MKIKIKDLRPNPFRDFENYPIIESKIEGLEKSIKQTGFWDNILVRKKGNKYEVAYGHHRLEVLRRNYKPDDEVGVVGRDLSDDDMIRIMLLENDEDYESRPRAFNEGIKQLFFWLKKSCGLIRTKKKTGYKREFLSFEKLPKHEGKLERYNVISWQIANWIAPDYSNDKVWRALEVLKKTGQIDIDAEGTREEPVSKKAVDMMPTKTAQGRLVKAAIKLETNHEQQEKAAERIVKKGDFSEQGIGLILIEEKSRNAPKEKTKKELQILEFEGVLKKAKKDLSKFNGDINKILKFRDLMEAENYKKSFVEIGIIPEFEILIDNLNKIGGKEWRTLKASKLLNS